MTSTREPYLTGGCQCGAVRFAIYAEPVRIGLCHCRMCQKAVGGPFISLAEVSVDEFAWTHGQPASFKSSSIAARDFCANCGTPLSYRKIGGTTIELTTGSFDKPDTVTPTYAVGTESWLSWTGSIANLPGKITVSTNVESHQHPDHDT